MGGDLTASSNGQTLWIQGDVYGIEVSTDGGRDWAEESVSTGGAGTSIATSTGSQAWLPAPNLGLYHTTNGTNWTLLPDPR